HDLRKEIENFIFFDRGVNVIVLRFQQLGLFLAKGPLGDLGLRSFGRTFPFAERRLATANDQQADTETQARKELSQLHHSKSLLSRTLTSIQPRARPGAFLPGDWQLTLPVIGSQWPTCPRSVLTSSASALSAVTVCGMRRRICEPLIPPQLSSGPATTTFLSIPACQHPRWPHGFTNAPA